MPLVWRNRRGGKQVCALQRRSQTAARNAARIAWGMKDDKFTNQFSVVMDKRLCFERKQF
jgi:hypothetical protein